MRICVQAATALEILINFLLSQYVLQLSKAEFHSQMK